jgi:hypothetical protein
MKKTNEIEQSSPLPLPLKVPSKQQPVLISRLYEKKTDADCTRLLVGLHEIN